ncbi:MAG: hypothetical protein KDE57_11895 [Calditrichaeota bacterium]|nr:hypothetical protein [Calditrichota bacterium]
MKLWKLTLLLVACLGEMALAQSRIEILRNETRSPEMNSAPYLELKAGGLTPKDVETGFLGGMSIGRNIDDRFFWGLEADVFKTNYRKETVIAEFVDPSNQISYNEIQVELDFSTTITSFYWQIYYETAVSNNVLFLRGLSGIGWSFIWNKENNFVDDVKRTRFFNGFTWQASAGLGVRASKLGLVFVDLYYQNAKPRKSDNRVEENLPVFQEIDLTGFGIRVGVNFLMMRSRFLGFLQ